MTDELRAKMIDKVRKLMALSTSPNENEAAQAAEKAQTILAEYNLSMSEVETDGKVEDKFITSSRVRTPSVPWVRYVAGAVGRMYFCKYYYTHEYVTDLSRQCGYVRKDMHSFVGASHNIEIAEMMFQYLIEAINRLSKEAIRNVHRVHRSGYDSSFKKACALRLASRIKDRIEAAKAGTVKSETTGTNLPALRSLYESNEKALTTYMEDQGTKLGKGRKSGSLSNAQGAADGRAAGDKIGLDPQVQGRASAHLLGR